MLKINNKNTKNAASEHQNVINVFLVAFFYCQTQTNLQPNTPPPVWNLNRCFCADLMLYQKSFSSTDFFKKNPIKITTV